MTDLRDKIADLMGYEFAAAMKSDHEIADAILALIRENVPPLVWEQRGETYWVSGSYKVYKGIEDRWYMERPEIIRQIFFSDDEEEPKAAANEHHRQAVLKAAGLSHE